MLKDGVVLEDSGGRIVINQYSFCELIKHLLTHYVKISYENASEIVSQSHLVTPISSAIDARLLNHEFPIIGQCTFIMANYTGKKEYLHNQMI